MVKLNFKRLKTVAPLILILVSICFMLWRGNSTLPFEFGKAVLSPDGQWCIVSAEDDKSPMRLIASNGRGGTRPIANTTGLGGATWASDSRHFYSVGDFSTAADAYPRSWICRVNAFDGTQSQVVIGQNEDKIVNYPEPSPNDRYLAYTETKETKYSATTGTTTDVAHIYDLKTGVDHEFDQLPMLGNEFQWRDGGRIVAYRTGVYKNKKSYGIVFCTPSENFSTRILPQTLGSFSISPDASLCAFRAGADSRGSSNILSIVKVQDGQELLQVKRPQIAPGMAWSEDGKYLCFVARLFSQPEICRLEIKTNQITVLVPQSETKKMALTGLRGNTLFYSIADGKNMSRLLTVQVS